MDLNEYQIASRRTTTKDATLLENRDYVLNYASMGLAGEVGELAEVLYNGGHRDSLRGELGDFMWYFARLVDAGGSGKWDLDTIVKIASMKEIDSDYFSNIHYTNTRLTIAVNKRIVDYVKKVVFHKHDFEADRFKGYLIDAMAIVIHLCQRWSFPLESILNQNIEKLKKRYPDGFSSDASKNRVA